MEMKKQMPVVLAVKPPSPPSRLLPRRELRMSQPQHAQGKESRFPQDELKQCDSYALKCCDFLPSDLP
jgi:hypothetical protein